MYEKSRPCPFNDCEGEITKLYHAGKEMHSEDLGETAELSQRHYMICNRCGAKGIQDTHAKMQRPVFKKLKLTTVFSELIDAEGVHLDLEKQGSLL